MAFSIVLLLIALLAACLVLMVAQLFRWGMEQHDVWSISIFEGPDPLALKPHSAVGNRPVLAAMQVTDITAEFVADPFLMRKDDRWYMFFEALERSSGLGVICVANSIDAIAWTYDKVVLREPFHLSYPYVFQDGDDIFMIPESGAAGSVRLYRANGFPYVWQYVRDILAGSFYDSSLIKWQELWWLFSMDHTHSLRLFHARAIDGPWSEHPGSPIIKRDLNVVRPAGRLLVHGDSLYRLAQDGEPSYGSSVRVFRVLKLTETEYSESEISASPVLRGSGTGWNATGMHHMDAQLLPSGLWIASVDGNSIRKVWNWRAAARGLQRSLVHRLRLRERPVT